MMTSAVLLCLASFAAADVHFSRVVSDLTPGFVGTLTIGPDGTCAKADAYGSDDCTMSWGSNYTAAYDVTLPKTVDATYKINVDLKIDGLLPLQFSCAACGANCTFTVPIIGTEVNIPAVQCPLVAAGAYNGTTVLPLPAKSPVGIKVLVKGTVSLVDGSGAGQGTVTVDGSL